MHWGTIRLSAEDPWEPPIRFKKAAQMKGYQKNKIWHGHSGATEFYNDLLSAFPDVDFRLTNIVIGPQGVVEEARVIGTHERDWLGFPASGDQIEFQVAIFFPWDATTRKFKGERIYFHFDESYYEKYGINP